MELKEKFILYLWFQRDAPTIITAGKAGMVTGAAERAFPSQTINRKQRKQNCNDVDL